MDTDGDGTIDGCDECPEDANKVAAGLCGCGLDDSLDEDGDGTPDCLDLCRGQNDRRDSDGDGTVDCFDDCPDDGGKTAAGQCGCGTPDAEAVDPEGQEGPPGAEGPAGQTGPQGEPIGVDCFGSAVPTAMMMLLGLMLMRFGIRRRR